MPVPGLPTRRGRAELGRVPLWTRGSGPALATRGPLPPQHCLLLEQLVHVGWIVVLNWVTPRYSQRNV